MAPPADGNANATLPATTPALAQDQPQGDASSNAHLPRTLQDNPPSPTQALSSEPSHSHDFPDRNLDDAPFQPPTWNKTDRPLGARKDAYTGQSVKPSASPPQPSAGQQHNGPSTPVDREKAQDPSQTSQPARPVSHAVTELYTLSYLVFFALLGTLARVGLQALTDYPGTPLSFSSIWPNFGGSLVMGFLAEDRKLFRDEWGTPAYDSVVQDTRQRSAETSCHVATARRSNIDLVAKRAHLATKKTLPLYIGLATGFCGSFTSFSSFVRDIFLALANNMSSASEPRNGGYSFMALVAVILVTLSLSLGGLVAGAHLASALEPVTPTIPYPFTRNVLDRVALVFGWGSWIGAIIMAAIPPNNKWRGQALFALVFAPLGCLARYYVSKLLNGCIASFPLGTFVANISGTMILGMSWDLAHVSLGGVAGCQVLQGVEDGFCGCLTTVSTWVAELATLRRRHAYIYGSASVVAGLSALIVIMGSLKWTDGYAPLQCSH